ncbi:hypothetical protein SBRCBS47491_004529 [Sporothrix bragantina]|uniref:AB hydrolase-1 domain-containing protein n=1 Tax=Sporothrix bragantina TaxID=671064 RepID=A0ABP0BPA9_9PEZI
MSSGSPRVDPVTNGPRALGRQSIARWFDKDFFVAYPERIAHAESVYCLAALKVLNLSPYAEDIGSRGDGARFVLVAGELDGTVPQESEALANIMGSEVVVIPKSGHITNIQLPDEFHSVISDILSSPVR